MKNVLHKIFPPLLACALALAPACRPEVKPGEAPPSEPLLKTPPEVEVIPKPSVPEPVKSVRPPDRTPRRAPTKMKPVPQDLLAEKPTPQQKPEPKAEPETLAPPQIEARGQAPTVINEPRIRNLFIGTYAGGAKLWGGKWNLSTVGPQVGLILRYHPVRKNLGFGLSLAYARFYCYEDIYEPQASEYKTDMFIAGLTATYDWSPHKTFSPYLTLKVGVNTWNNQMPPFYQGQPIMEWGDPASNIKGTNLHLGPALGLRTKISPTVSLFAEGYSAYFPNDKMNVGHHDANNLISGIITGAMFGF